MGQHSSRERGGAPNTGNRDRRRIWMCKPQSSGTIQGHTTVVHCPDAYLKQPEAVAHMDMEKVPSGFHPMDANLSADAILKQAEAVAHTDVEKVPSGFHPMDANFSADATLKQAEAVAHMDMEKVPSGFHPMVSSHSAAALDQPDDDHEEMRWHAHQAHDIGTDWRAWKNGTDAHRDAAFNTNFDAHWEQVPVISDTQGVEDTIIQLKLNRYQEAEHYGYCVSKSGHGDRHWYFIYRSDKIDDVRIKFGIIP